MNKIINERLKCLREQMKHNGVDYLLIPTADFHNSEYVNDYFKVRQFFSGFTGSNGNLLVWKDGAGLWTDGRYYIQAANQLEGTGVTLFRMMDAGVPSIQEYLMQNMKRGETLGFDGRVVPICLGQEYCEVLKKIGGQLKTDCSFEESIWTDRPNFPCGKIEILNESLTGMNFSQKRELVMNQLSAEGADAFFLTKLDDIMWLTNIRGCDVACNPVAMSYFYMDLDTSLLFIQRDALCPEQAEELEQNGILVKEYSKVGDYLIECANKKVLLDDRHCSFKLYEILKQQNQIIIGNNPTELLKAVKNSVEQQHMREIYLKDSVALTKFIFWLKKNVISGHITEVSAADYLEKLRREIPECFDLSFPSISAYGANAAMMHYAPNAEKEVVLEPKGMYLIDSGGQYYGGTTDVTRTIVLGEITPEMKYHYTKVLGGFLQVMNAHWLYGCSGKNLDILARQPLWDIGMDYQCGTGHGVGYILNVHEGPQNMRWKYTEGMIEVPIEAGMDITDEPGVYIEGQYGIRIENVLLAQNDIRNTYGQFMKFENLTWVPVDPEAIDLSALSSSQIEYLKAYQKEVYNRLSPYLDDEIRKWLYEETDMSRLG